MAHQRRSRRPAPQLSTNPTTPSAGWNVWLCVLVLIVAPLAVFGRAVNFGFVDWWDDNLHLWDNPYFQPFSLSHLLQLWYEPYFGEYVPMLYTWFGGCLWLSGVIDGQSTYTVFNPMVFHAGNLVLHVSCGLLVFRLLRRLLQDNRAACCGALVFALHPIVTEPVAWVSEARGLLAMFFGLLAVWHYLESVTPAATSGLPAVPKSTRWRVAHYVLGTVFFALALASKPSAVSWPLVAAALDWGFLRRDWRAMAKSLAPWLVLTAVLTVVTKFEQSADSIREIVPLWQRPLVAADALAFYLYKLAVPLQLIPDHGRMPSVAFARGWPYWTWIVPAVAGVALWRLGNRVAWTAAAVFVAGLAPVLGFIPFIFQDISTVADRYVYIALLGPALLCGWLVTRRPGPIFYAVLGLLLLGWSVIGWQQVGHWRNSEAIFTHSLQVNPNSRIMLYNLVASLCHKQQFEEALEPATRSLEIAPDEEKAYLNLGVVLRDLKRLDEAGDVLQKGIQANPKSVILRRVLAQVRMLQGRPAESKVFYEQILAIEPANVAASLGLANVAIEQGDRATVEQIYKQLSRQPPADAELRMMLGDLAAACGDLAAAREHYMTVLPANVDRGEVWFKIGRLEYAEGALPAARAAFQESMRLGKNDTDVHRYLAMVFEGLDQHATAAEHYRVILAVDPNDPMALNNLAWILATSRDAALRDGPQAVRLAEQLRQRDESQAQPLDTLAAAYAEAGRFEEAAQTARQAIAKAEAAGDRSLAEEARARLRIYEQGQPYRQPAALIRN